jgi:hypothetical protein
VRIFRAPTSSAVALALTFAGMAIALAQTALPAIGYELSSEQGYALLILAAMFCIGAVIALFWHSIKKIRISLAPAMGDRLLTYCSKAVSFLPISLPVRALARTYSMW